MGGTERDKWRKEAAEYNKGASNDDYAWEVSWDFYHVSVFKRTCAPLDKPDHWGSAIGVVIAVVLAAINMVLAAVIARLVAFERHASHSAQHCSQFAKTAVSQYLNISVVPLLASAEINWLAPALGEVVFARGYPDFTTNWCAPSRAPATDVALPCVATRGLLQDFIFVRGRPNFLANRCARPSLLPGRPSSQRWWTAVCLPSYAVCVPVIGASPPSRRVRPAEPAAVL